MAHPLKGGRANVEAKAQGESPCRSNAFRKSWLFSVYRFLPLYIIEKSHPVNPQSEA